MDDQMALTSKYLATAVLIAAGLVIGPIMISGHELALDNFLPRISSYIYGFSLVFFIFFCSAIGERFFSIISMNSSSNIKNQPFISAAVGLVILFCYIYVRSVLGVFLPFPITAIELLVIGVFFLAWRYRTSHVTNINWTIPSVAKWLIFYIACVGLAENDLPRLIMLSSDPDQHALFAQLFLDNGKILWGEESIGYPAGTGVFGFLLASISGLSIQNSIAAIPTLQAMLSIFLIINLITARNDQQDNSLLTYIWGLIIFAFLLPYGFDRPHFHLEGYGRLSSLWLVCLAATYYLIGTHFFINSSRRACLFSIVLCSTVIFVATTFNPINLFLIAPVIVLSHFLIFRFKYWYLGFLFPLFSTLLLLDPYYFSMIFGGSARAGADLTTSFTFNMSIKELLIQSYLNVPNTLQSYHLFFKFPFLGHLYLSTIGILIAILLTSKKAAEVTYLLGMLCIVFIGWAAYSSIFLAIVKFDETRLLYPYLQYSTFQFLFAFLLVLLTITIAQVTRGNFSRVKVFLIFAILASSFSLFKSGIPEIRKEVRYNYCGPMGCATIDDERVLLKSNEIFDRYAGSENPPKMLISNALRTHFNEKWLMPHGGSRLAPHASSFPLAFYYYQGAEDYSYTNYKNYVCDNFKVSWLRQRNIQYLFLPSQMGSSCIAKFNNLENRFEIVARSGASRLFKLY